MRLITEGFDGFSKGTFENGGQNLYVSHKGVLQRIFQYDVNQDGYPDLLFANSQSMNERPPVYVYSGLPGDNTYTELPSGGTYDGILADLFGSGYEDLIIACQHNGSHSDVCAMIYFGNADGFSEQYRMELPVPNAISVCAGDFNGDGKLDLAFVSGTKLRVFYQQEGGFSPALYTDYPVEAVAIAAVSDGLHRDNLVAKNAQNQLGVIPCNRDGLCTDSVQWIDLQQNDTSSAATGSTAGLAESSAQWKPCVLSLDGNQYIFAADGDDAVFYTWGDTKLEESFRLNCPGVVAATSGDVFGNSLDDLVLTVFRGRDEKAPCRVYPNGGKGIDKMNYVPVTIQGAASATIAHLDGNTLVFSRIGESCDMEVATPILRFHKDDTYEVVTQILCGDCMKILACKTRGNDQLITLNHKLNTVKGEEDVYIYLGGTDGYEPDRKVTLTGHSVVEGTMCDFLDRGLVDVLLSNCCEDDPMRNKGAALHLNNGNGFDKNHVIELPVLHTHGSAVGDFRKSGFLDIAVGGIFNREIRILHGSEHGYSLDRATRVVLGPDDGSYLPMGCRKEAGFIKDFSDEDKKLVTQYGQIRWMLAADFNGDGWLDLFVSEICGPKSFILWGGPDGFSYENRQELLTDGVASATAVDLNGNGWLDLILSQHQSMGKSNPKESYVTVYWGSPDGYCENRKMQLPAHCANSVTVGDYNGNGSFDIYATSYHNGRSRDLLSFLYHGDHGKFSPSRVQYLFNHSGCGCVSGDFNGDGYTDLAVASHKGYGNHKSESYIFWGGPDGLSEDRKTILPTVGPHGMCTVDPGNIRDRSGKEHYTSQVFQIPEGANVQAIRWEGECTSTSWVELELRAASDVKALDAVPWQKVAADEDISSCCFCGYVQYRLALCAKCACGTPRITRVIIDFN